MKVLICYPNEKSLVYQDIKGGFINKFFSFREIVDGKLDIKTLDTNERYWLISNYYGMSEERPLNKLINGIPVYGTFIICKHDKSKDDFKDITEEDKILLERNICDEKE